MEENGYEVEHVNRFLLFFFANVDFYPSIRHPPPLEVEHSSVLFFHCKFIFFAKYQAVGDFAQKWAQSSKPRKLARKVLRDYSEYLSKMSVLSHIFQLMRFASCLKRMKTVSICKHPN